MFRTFSLLLIAVFTTVAARADAVLDWNAQALGAIRTSKTPPPMAARNLAILHVALFDAVNGVTPNYTPYVVQPGAPAGASADAAAAQAGYVVLSSLYPALQSFWDTQLAALLAPIPAGQPKTDGTQWGSSVAQAILASRQNDGAFASVPYVPVLLPGHWRPTLPAFAPALFPQWPNVTPFSLESGSQFRPKGPPPLHSGRYLADWFMVKRLGEQNSKWRSPDQTQIALFWSDGGGTATPPGHWNEIAAIVSAQRHLSLIDNAALFALLNIAEADAGIACWDAKYTFNFWRPITAIREADTDGNWATRSDPDWTPLLPTPPFPECTSGHSTFSAAGAAILASFFQRDRIQLDVTTDALPGVVRHFRWFSQMAEEAGISRVYGGIHFQFSNLEGRRCGYEIGNYVTEHEIQPLH